MTVNCLKCGEPLEPDMKACPKCGSRDRLVTVSDSLRLMETVGVKQKAEGYHRFKKYSRHGEKISKTGKLARETLIIDKETKRKYHIVEEQNETGEWIIVHKEDESL